MNVRLTESVPKIDWTLFSASTACVEVQAMTLSVSLKRFNTFAAGKINCVESTRIEHVRGVGLRVILRVLKEGFEETV